MSGTLFLQKVEEKSVTEKQTEIAAVTKTEKAAVTKSKEDGDDASGCCQCSLL